MQTFRDQAVREKMLREEESVPYLLRKHCKVARTGFSTVGQAAAATTADDYDPLKSIYARMAEGREFSQRDG